MKKVGLSIKDLAFLCNVPTTTAYSWLARNTIAIPAQCSMYLSAIAATANKISSKKLEQNWQTQITTTKQQKQSQKVWKEQYQQLELEWQRCEIKLKKLQQKKQQQLHKQSLAQQLPDFFPANYKHLPQALDTMNLWQRKASFDLGQLVIDIGKLEQRMAGIKGQLNYLEAWVELK